MEQKRNNQKSYSSHQQQMNTKNESPQYPIITPLRSGTSKQNRNKINSNRNNNDANIYPRSNGYNSNSPSKQSQNMNLPSNLPRLNNLTNQTSQSNIRCNQQQLNSNNQLYINPHELNQQVPSNNINLPSIQVKGSDYPIVNPISTDRIKSPRRNNPNRTRNMNILTDQIQHNHNHHINNDITRNSNGELYTNVEEDPWDDYTIDRNDVNDNQSCAICISDFEIDEKAIKLKCGHIFHKCCIIPWYDDNIRSPTCPICRKNLSNYNFSQIMVIVKEANSLLYDINSLYADANSYLNEANSFCQQLNLNDEYQLNRLYEYMNRIENYTKKITIYRKRMMFYNNRLGTAEIPSDLNENQKISFISQAQSFLTKASSSIDQGNSLIEKLKCFCTNAKNISNSVRSANLNEMNSNLNGNSTYITETNSHEINVKSSCCILI